MIDLFLFNVLPCQLLMNPIYFRIPFVIIYHSTKHSVNWNDLMELLKGKVACGH